MGATKKFWTLPELGEKLISLLDPLSALHLMHSDLMDKEILKKSLTSKAWGELVRNSSVKRLAGFEEKMEDVKALVKILHFMELEEPAPLLMPLLDLICEASPGHSVEMVCPCHPEPHSISAEGFLLLEEVEAAFSTTEQSLKSISCGFRSHGCNLLSALSSRMTRQRKETVSSIYLLSVVVEDKSSLEAFLTLMQAEVVTVNVLDVRRAEMGTEGWRALARALRGKTKVVGNVSISRQDLGASFVPHFSERTLRPVCSIKDIWDATGAGFEIFNRDGSRSEYVDKPGFNWEGIWSRLKQIVDMPEDDFSWKCGTKWDIDEDTEGEGEGGEEEERSDEDTEGEGGGEENG